MSPQISQETKDAIMRWLLTGNVVLSSKCIASTMLGIPVAGFDAWTPSDPSDFCRCLKLLRCAPEIRGHMDAMRSVSKAWNRLVDDWEQIEACFMGEVPEWLEGKALEKSAHCTYELMHRLAQP